MDLRQFFEILRVRWKFSAAALLFGTVATFFLVFSIAPQYGSTSKLFISTPVGNQTDYTAALFSGQRVASYADLAKSPELMQSIATELNLGVTYEELQKMITADVVPSTQTIEIGVKAQTPELAQKIADAEAQGLIRLVARLETPSTKGQQPAFVARVAGKPSFSTTPVAPNVPLDLLVGILLSLFVGVGGALLRDLLDRTVKSRQDVEELTDHVVMATLPFERQVKRQPLNTDGRGAFAEAFRVLRTNLEFANLDTKRQVILVSSAVPDEGKTLIATNLAMSIAQAGQRVLLIDADMRNPNVAKLLGLENSVGVVSALIGRVDVAGATQPHNSGIHFLGTGPMPPNPAELLTTAAMRELIAEVREHYDVVVIDAPPLLPVADASILATEVDGLLLVTRYGSTTREQLRLAVARLDTVGGKMLGVVLNRTPRRQGDLYGYGYGYGIDPVVAKAARREAGLFSSGTRRAKH